MKVIDGTIASPLGFSADGLHAGFKKRKMDFGWIVSEKPASVGGAPRSNAAAKSRIGPEAACAITEIMPTAPTERNGRNRPSS